MSSHLRIFEIHYARDPSIDKGFQYFLPTVFFSLIVLNIQTLCDLIAIHFTILHLCIISNENKKKWEKIKSSLQRADLWF